MRASGEQPYPRFEFLDRLVADGKPAFGNVEAEEIKALEKRDNFGLVLRKGETQLDAQEIINGSQSLFSVGVRATQDHEIIGVAHKAKARLCQMVVKQVKDDVRQKGRNDPTLRSAGSGRAEFEPIHHASREKLTNNAQDIAVSDVLRDAIEDEIMGDVIEESFDVSVHDPFIPGSVSCADSFNRLMRVAKRPKAKRELREKRLKDGFEKSANDSLSDAVSDGGDAQRTKIAIRFRNEDPAQRGGVKAAFMLEVKQQSSKIAVEVGFKSANADFINSGSAAIAFDSQKSTA